MFRFSNISDGRLSDGSLVGFGSDICSVGGSPPDVNGMATHDRVSTGSGDRVTSPLPRPAVNGMAIHDRLSTGSGDRVASPPPPDDRVESMPEDRVLSPSPPLPEEPVDAAQGNGTGVNDSGVQTSTLASSIFGYQSPRSSENDSGSGGGGGRDSRGSGGGRGGGGGRNSRGSGGGGGGSGSRGNGVGPCTYCLPRHAMHFQPLSLDLSGTL